MRAVANMVPATTPDKTANAAHATRVRVGALEQQAERRRAHEKADTIDAYATPVKSPAWLGPPASALITKNTPTQP